jgi:nucleotide-binding universal stress UspA family protein
MSEADDRDESADLDPADTSEHAQRNRIQLEVLKLAVERTRHGRYIEAMLEQAGATQGDARIEGTDAAQGSRRD